MRILVTGGSGFIGGAVVAALLEAGHEIRVLDRRAPDTADRAGPPGAAVEFRQADIVDETAVTSALRGMDLVCHQAAMVGRGQEILDAPRFAYSNDLGTGVLLAAMTRAGLGRLVLASSVVLYGDCRYSCREHGRVRPPRRETADLEAGRFEPRCPQCGSEVVASAVEEDDLPDPPRNVYAVTKLAQELLVSAWVRETAGVAVALRYHSVYGPGMPFDSPYSGVAAAFRTAVGKGLSPRVYEDGLPRRDFVHVRDVAAANVAALDWTEPGFHPFNVASGAPHSIYDLALALSRAVGGPPPTVTGEYRVGDVRHVFASPAKAARGLGWRAAIDFPTGTKEFATASMRGTTR
ncbi:NAD-dependent epimerase/dehydratase family protein [Actinoallomurus purpureus]|uniref:NAD-dependent epimerase/dehydratase family protein n=1 Tax=Actinoallomurus purpureus TaxID=478114 RepID=UPI0020939ADF|nr:NAD-dependent epimerase/dehydratase family protein [Actinoallomurus purpureus]MCO6008410.1 NAD-dependent epimerase/dehydratase family protein [Actinoallomurus purpureus]